MEDDQYQALVRTATERHAELVAERERQAEMEKAEADRLREECRKLQERNDALRKQHEAEMEKQREEARKQVEEATRKAAVAAMPGIRARKQAELEKARQARLTGKQTALEYIQGVVDAPVPDLESEGEVYDILLWFNEQVAMLGKQAIEHVNKLA
jgi:hypothetical protein